MTPDERKYKRSDRRVASNGTKVISYCTLFGAVGLCIDRTHAVPPYLYHMLVLNTTIHGLSLAEKIIVVVSFHWWSMTSSSGPNTDVQPLRCYKYLETKRSVILSNTHVCPTSNTYDHGNGEVIHNPLSLRPKSRSTSSCLPSLSNQNWVDRLQRTHRMQVNWHGSCLTQDL